MANYRGTEAFDYAELGQNNMRYNTLPKIREFPGNSPQPKARPKVVKKTRQQLLAEKRRADLRAFKALITAAVLLSFIGLIIYSRVQLDNLSRQIETEQAKLSVLESENTRLNMKMDSVTSLDKVEDYAVNVLGMVKQDGYQVEYVDLKGSDEVVYSGGKGASSSESGNHLNFLDIWNKIF